jgi:hypothetical protein
MTSLSPFPLALIVVLGLAAPVATPPAAAQSPTQKPPARPAPSTAKPSTAKPSTAKPSTAKPPTAKPGAPETAKAPTAPPPQDVRFKSIYTAGDMKTESVTYIKGERERYEFQDMVLLKQPDQKRTIQISRTANTYLVAPDGMPPALVPGAAPAAPPKPPGVIAVATTIVDTGERKPAFGQQARHVKVMIDKQPMADACDTTKQRIETDGWYIDAPRSVASQPAASEQAAPSPDGCADKIQATSNGDPKVLGFPIAYTTTVTGDDGKPVIASMEVTEFEATTLDQALFEIPMGLNAAMNIRELSKALSDANEAKLVAADSAPPAAPASKAPGAVRIGVPELTNKTPQTVDTRALRQRLIGDLAEVKFEAMPMVAGTPADLQKRAGELGYDYVLFAEVSELKVNKPGGLGGLMKAAGGVAGGRGGVAGAAAGAAAGTATAPKENTESSLAVKLVQPDGKQRLSTTAKGKDGSGFSLKSGLGIAKYAGGMYLSMMAGPMMMSRMASMGAYNMGGMGMLGNPMLYRMQGAGLSGLGKGIGLDATAGAAAYLMQTAMTMDSLGGYVGLPGLGPSYDESLGEAVQNAAKAVEKALQKK